MGVRKRHADWQNFLCGIPAEDYVFQDEAYEVQIERAKELPALFTEAQKSSLRGWQSRS